MLSAKDITGMYAIIPTPALPGANRLDARDTVDLDESERLVNKLIRDGSDGLIILGTTGECATVTQSEYEAFVDCVIKTVNKRIPVFAGATALGAHDVYSRLKFVQQQGADGSLLGMPMWQPLTVPMAVEYYKQVSEAFPKLSIMVYANARAFRFSFPVEFWGAVAKAAPTVVAAKSSRPNGLAEMIAATNRQINFVPIDQGVVSFYEISPETTTACWATAAAMGPSPSIAVMRAVRDRDNDRMKKVSADIAWANEPVKPMLENPELFASHNIQLEKHRIDAAGYCKPGPVRAPYDYMPPEHEKAARECGRRWAEICKRYAN
nr:K171 [uncultured bacterium]